VVFSGGEASSGDKGQRRDFTGGDPQAIDQLQAQTLREMIQELHEAMMKWGSEGIKDVTLRGPDRVLIMCEDKAPTWWRVDCGEGLIPSKFARGDPDLT